MRETIQKSKFNAPSELSIINCSGKSSQLFEGLVLDTMDLNIAAKIGRLGAQQLHRIQSGEPLEKSILINARYVKGQTTVSLV